MIGVLEITGANSVKFSARGAVMPMARMPAATATALRIQAVLTCIALPPWKTGVAGDPNEILSIDDKADSSVEGRSHSVRQDVLTARTRRKFGCRSAQ